MIPTVVKRRQRISPTTKSAIAKTESTKVLKLRPGIFLLLACSLLLVHQVSSSHTFQPRSSYYSSYKSISRICAGRRAPNRIRDFTTPFGIPRGGSSSSEPTATVDSSDTEDEEEEEESLDDTATTATATDTSEESNNNTKNKTTAAASASSSIEPVQVLVKTNVGNQLLDQSVELSLAPTRNIAWVKQTLSRQLPGKPPLEQIRIMQHGKILDEEMVLQELLEDDEDDEDDEAEEEEENKPRLTLVLDMVPPVDPRFHSELKQNMEDMTTADLFEAYTLNEAALWYRSKYWTEKMKQEQEKEDTEGDQEEEEQQQESMTAPTNILDADAPLISFQLRQHANILKAELEETMVTEKTAPLLEDNVPPAQTEREKASKTQVRGQRVRPGAAGGSGPSSSVVGLRQNVQHNLNIVSYLWSVASLVVGGKHYC